VRKHVCKLFVDFFLYFVLFGILEERNSITGKVESGHMTSEEMFRIIQTIWMIIDEDELGGVVITEYIPRIHFGVQCGRRRGWGFLTKRTLMN
jgi:hypothetical protein